MLPGSVDALNQGPHRRLTEQHDQPDPADQGHKADENPGPGAARVPQTTDLQGEVGNNRSKDVENKKLVKQVGNGTHKD